MAAEGHDYHRGEMDIREQANTFHAFGALTKWLSLATAVILVHNHSSGDPTPSSADVQMTRQINEIAKPLGIAVHDHVIIGRSGHVSMKGLRLTV